MLLIIYKIGNAVNTTLWSRVREHGSGGGVIAIKLNQEDLKL
ncbi:hypothetical protein Wcon_01545 [Wolbachia endosymbiont of Cylisticus convexus]|nr:hypothetical protein Wcon_01614 [Wolbachia endosymbiont of Cylisticus convexus]RDD34376.1 hypothetical protein Wcon_01545 [Wolbachia endosymbiont of Cylisticus convexus]